MNNPATPERTRLAAALGATSLNVGSPAMASTPSAGGACHPAHTPRSTQVTSTQGKGMIRG